MKSLRVLIAAAFGLAFGLTASAGGGAEHPHPPEGGWPFQGGIFDGNPTNAIFGEYESDSLQRGFHVYRQICASCHGMKLLSYRNLAEPFGPFYSSEYPNANDNPVVKQITSEIEILAPELNDAGDYDYRPATPADRFRSPYPNDVKARLANNGALPPDFSTIAKARSGGASYIYSLMSGYPSDDLIQTRELENGEIERYMTFGDPHAEESGHGEGHGAADCCGELIIPAGQYYNPYFAGDTSPNWRGDPRHAPVGGFLAMAPQLMEGRVEFADGTPATVEQMAYDVTQFLSWASEPKRQGRLQLGFGVLIYLFGFAILTYLSYKAIWRGVKH